MTEEVEIGTLQGRIVISEDQLGRAMARTAPGPDLAGTLLRLVEIAVLAIPFAAIVSLIPARLPERADSLAGWTSLWFCLVAAVLVFVLLAILGICLLLRHMRLALAVGGGASRAVPVAVFVLLLVFEAAFAAALWLGAGQGRALLPDASGAQAAP
ncbi:hypothetical protein [Mangrovicoccus algicola]|uniref:Uncharacterized protein n=1 Tax=Mangrovicoccus algicola TaxID=2771008 RepID=A0A8J7CI41_9RHOB|nr:hypothetical protein [Mangrovicoccus algicola]MBE3639120.1 hypothetical protein [Mangrovicoccus algicola]